MAQDTIRRQWLILKKLPRRPHSITASQLHSLLASEGHTVTLRSVQRDLMDLSGEFPVVTVDENAKPIEWYWSEDAALFDLPDMDAHTAVTFKLVSTFMRNLLPPSVLGAMTAHFRRADEVLQQGLGKALSTWAHKVRVVHHGPTLQPAEVDPAVLATVYEGLLKQRRFEVSYRKRGAKTDVTHKVNPFALVARDAVLYLVCSLNEHDKPITLAMHRIRGARLLDEAAKVPAGFDLDAYLHAGQVEFALNDKPITLKVAFDPRAAPTVEETPLHRDQAVSTREDGWRVITATVMDTRALRGWLFSYGALVEVLEPAEMRRHFAEAATQMASRHAGG